MSSTANNVIRDETDYLNSSRRNRELLEAAIREAEQGGGVHVTLEEFEHPSPPIPTTNTIPVSKDIS